MTIRYHISDDLLVAYEAGGLAEGWSLAVATHLALCPHCRARSRQAAAIGGALIELLPPAEIEEDALASVLARLGSVEPAGRTPPVVGGSRVIPDPLRSYVGDLPDIRWRRLGMNSRHLLVETGDPLTRVRLLCIPAGESVPEHGHRGRELTLVLAGRLIDGDVSFVRGDLEDADEALEHHPVAGPEEDCICLAVTNAPLRFKSRFVRLIQPFLGI